MNAETAKGTNGFYLHRDTRNMFGFKNQKMFSKGVGAGSQAKDMLLFDAYWASLCIGLYKRKLGKLDDLEKDRILPAYPEDYDGQADYIAGLLVEAELFTLHTEDFSEKDFERAISKLLKVSSPTRLSPEGMRQLNLYAAGGFEIMRDRMKPKPTDPANFLSRFSQLLTQLEKE